MRQSPWARAFNLERAHPSSSSCVLLDSIHEMIETAGLENFETIPGWRSIPLERLAYEQPDLVAAAFFGTTEERPDAWSAINHPVARAQLVDDKIVPLDGAWTSCNGWYLVDAIEVLSQGAGK